MSKQLPLKKSKTTAWWSPTVMDAKRQGQISNTQKISKRYNKNH